MTDFIKFISLLITTMRWVNEFFTTMSCSLLGSEPEEHLSGKVELILLGARGQRISQRTVVHCLDRTGQRGEVALGG